MSDVDLLPQVLVIRDLATVDELGPNDEVVMLPRRGRDPVVIELSQVEQLAALGLTLQQISDYFGVSYASFNSYRRKLDALDCAWSQGRAKGIALVAQANMAAVKKGQFVPGFFFLKNVAGWRDQEPKAAPEPAAQFKVELYLPENGR